MEITVAPIFAEVNVNTINIKSIYIQKTVKQVSFSPPRMFSELLSI